MSRICKPAGDLIDTAVADAVREAAVASAAQSSSQTPATSRSASISQTQGPSKLTGASRSGSSLGPRPQGRGKPMPRRDNGSSGELPGGCACSPAPAHPLCASQIQPPLPCGSADGFEKSLLQSTLVNPLKGIGINIMLLLSCDICLTSGKKCRVQQSFARPESTVTSYNSA